MVAQGEKVMERFHFLSGNERLEIKNLLMDFVRRVSSNKEERIPAEIEILPEMIKFLLNTY